MFITAVARILCIDYGAASHLTQSSSSQENVLVLQSVQQKHIYRFWQLKSPTDILLLYNNEAFRRTNSGSIL